MSSNIPIKDFVLMNINLPGGISRIMSELMDLSYEWCREQRGNSPFLVGAEKEKEEVDSPEFKLENSEHQGLKDFALTIDICNKIAHQLIDRETRIGTPNERDGALVRGRIMRAVKDMLMQKFADECIKNRVKCGIYKDYDSEVDVFGAFIEDVGEISWHLGNNFSSDALGTAMDMAFMKYHVPRRLISYDGDMRKGMYDNIDKLLGEMPQSELNKEKKTWGLDGPNR